MISASTACFGGCHLKHHFFRELNHKTPLQFSCKCSLNTCASKTVTATALHLSYLGHPGAWTPAENTANLCNQTHFGHHCFSAISVEPFPFTSRRQSAKCPLAWTAKVGIIHQKSPSPTSIIAPGEHRTLSSKAGSTA